MKVGDTVEILDQRGVVENGVVVSVSTGGIGVHTVSGIWTVPGDGSASRSGRRLWVLSAEEREARAVARRARADALQALGALGLHLPGRAGSWDAEKLCRVAAAADALREALS